MKVDKFKYMHMNRMSAKTNDQLAAEKTKKKSQAKKKEAAADDDQQGIKDLKGDLSGSADGDQKASGD